MRITLRVLAVAVSTAAVAVPAVAAKGTAKPVPNGIYCINCTAKLSPGQFHVAKNGKTIDAWNYYNKCAPVPVPKVPKIAIKHGKFAYSGVLMTVIHKKVHFTLKGHFVTPKLAKGTVNATGGGKTCTATTFKAKFTATGPLGVG